MTSTKGPWHYDRDKQKQVLLGIYNRYFRQVIAHPDGTLTHHGDCDTHRAFGENWHYQNAPCTCGLLHDLRWVASSISVKLYPEQWDDELRAEGIKPDPPEVRKERRKKLWEMSKIVSEVCAEFGPPVGPTPEEKIAIEKMDWGLIEEVFGEHFAQRQKNKYKARQIRDEEDGMSYYKIEGKNPGCVESPDS